MAGPAETVALGASWASGLRAGDVLALYGPLGAGKTVLVRGLAQGLGVRGPVRSPTFTLINEYRGPLPLYHVDLYRLDDPLDWEDIGLYDILDSGDVIAIEWAEKMPARDLAEHLSVAFKILDDSRRKLTFSATGQPVEDLLKKIEKL